MAKKRRSFRRTARKAPARRSMGRGRRMARGRRSSGRQQVVVRIEQRTPVAQYPSISKKKVF